MQYLLLTVTNTSELGTIMNIESLNVTPGKNFLNKYDSLLQANTNQTLIQPPSELLTEYKNHRSNKQNFAPKRGKSKTESTHPKPGTNIR